MAQKKLSIPFLAILILGLVATVVLGAIITRQLENKDVSSDEIPSPSITATSQPTTSPDASPAATIMQPKVPKPTYPEGWKEYHNEKYGYSYAYPGKIFAYGFTRDANVAQYSYKDDGYDFEVTGFGVEGLEDFGGVKVTHKDVIDLKKDLLIYNNISIKETTFNGYAATYIFSEYQNAHDKLLPQVHILIQHKDFVYVLNWQDGKISELSYEAIGKQILATFRID